MSISAVLTATFLLAAGAAFAQQPWDAAAFSSDPKAMLQAAAAIPKEKKADVLVFLDEERIKVDESGRASHSYRMVYRVDTPSGVEHWASLAYRYSPWYEARPVIKARVITPDGAVHELDQKTLTDIAVRDRSENVFSDDHEYEGPLPAVTVGALVEEQGTVEDTAPFFEGSWSARSYFGRKSVPVLHSTVTVDTPSSHPLHFVARLLPDVKVTKSEANGTVTTVFDQGRLELTDLQDLLPPEAARSPYLGMTTANSWQELAQRYAKRAEPQVRPQEVKSLVADISGSQDEIIAGVLAKMHANARYTGVEFGESAIIPQPPAETLKRKYGDCKDKATLLVSMLRAAGVPANLVLLNAGDDQDVDAEVPGMTWFDHAIVYLPTKKMYIDATAEYARPADLPSGDQGRLALVVAEDTKELQRIPELPSSTNGKTEKREMYLAESGLSRIVESTQWFGPKESSLRSSYDGGQNKEERKSLENYVKNMYLAESLTKYEHSDPLDMKKPFTLRLEVSKARRGNTELDSALAAIRVMDLVDQQFPDEILQEEKKESDDTPADDRRKPRTVDWYLTSASTAEWRYTITPPRGFIARGLPENKTTKFGPAVLTEEYKIGTDGVVLANIRVDTLKRRYTVAEVNELRESWKQFKNHGVVLVYFDLNGNKLIQQGKVKEGLAEIRTLTTMHPKEGLHRAQLARAFLAAGLGDMAREEAHEAVKLDPKSDVAWSTEGFVLLHDLFGRQFSKGWDPAGTIAAYKKAKELDPKNAQYRFDLGMAEEYDAEGDRYSDAAHLKDAVIEYKDMRKLDTVNLENVNERLVYAMVYAGQIKELRDELTQLGDKPLFNAMRVFCAATLDGADEGVKLAGKITDGEQARSNALVTAGTMAMRSRRYPEAQVLLAAGAAGQSNAGAMTNLANVLKQARKFEDVRFDEKDPVGFSFRLGQLVKTENSDWQKVMPYMSRANHELPGDWLERYVKREFFVHTKAELPEKVLLDVGMGMLKASADGDDAVGYRISIQGGGITTRHEYMVKEDGAFKILAESHELVALGQEVLDRIARNDLKGGKALLDWAREDVKLPGGEDPYAGPPFPMLWSKGQDADAGKMRVAATMLLFGVRDAMKPYVQYIAAEREKATTDADKLKLDIALMHAYFNYHDWPAAEEAGKRVLAVQPSPTILDTVAAAMRHQKKWAATDAVVEELRPKMSDDMAAPRQMAKTLEVQGDLAGAMKLMKPYVENGKATVADVNNYGWMAVMAGAIPPDVLQAVQQSVQQSNNKAYPIMHTLACMYAEAGMVKQAQQTLLEALKLDPNTRESGIWYGYARLAENYGEYEAAAKLYRKVERPVFFEGDASATYALAQNRLVVLGGTQGTAAAK